MRTALTFAAALFAVACSPSKYDYAGFRIYDHFPLDGERDWEYKSDAEDYLLRATLLTPPKEKGTKKISTIEYSQKDPYKILYQIRWSSDSSDGIHIHGYIVEDLGGGGGDDTGETDDTGADLTDVVVGSWVEFDPPLQLAEYQMAPLDSVSGTAGGDDYTSTFTGTEDCPNLWVDDWECLRFEIAGGGDVPPPFVGTWWWATEWGASRFLPAGADVPWVLTEADWAP